MLFNSFEFALLMLLLMPAYRLLARWRAQNLLLLAGSYVFYGWWDHRFLPLLLASTLTDYLVARALEATAAPRPRRALLVLSCVVNLGLLGFFKYWGLFESTANGIGHWLGSEDALLPALQLVLPVGISFYTFQTLAYTVDVYRGRIRAVRSLRDLALYVGFFPQLVAGPIERPSQLLPQIRRDRVVRLGDVEQGVFLFASGWFRKALGDVMGTIVDPVFADPASHGAWSLLWALYAFAFQIYLDFSGYTDMARGVARVLGFELMENFNAPYFARSVREFWQRWHISLSTWLRDYLYIPLGGNRGGAWRTQRNLVLTMLLGGLWHGAAWNFVVWGALHGLYLAVDRAVRGTEAPGAVGAARPSERGGLARSALGMALTFHLVLLGWLLFRVRPVGDEGALAVAVGYLQGLSGLWHESFVAPPLAVWPLALVLCCDLLMVRTGSHVWVRGMPWPLRGGVVALLLTLGFVLDSGPNQAFIYFQF